ncbi:dTDP-4-dehydrorhamnose reductase [Colwellia sp. MB02u-6]|uniref:dTDP-4-dehydrorhamnose reductase n=1 Tax=Colwellia sp. MB02u-6 TaxID=2759824 RepID=UPI0015F390A6|nr:dTDP-4-dehydrorhamnose reductase [Colwellia sp. MB02u-6]MBA6326399.1 dTDP-4-dehydrorhamnose reductase [Colwellia sp. MB02u-6]
MNIVVIGKSGQLASEIAKLSVDDTNIICLGRLDIDLLNVDSISEKLIDLAANAVINASAYTAVDLAETEPEQTYLLNSEAVGNLSMACANVKIKLVHVSTDFVFDGKSNLPYSVNDTVNPISVYGASKAEGEKLIQKYLPEQSCIIRTSWVYSTFGNNFVKTMIRFMAEKPELSIISDQIGTPTFAGGLAKICLHAAMNNTRGIHHYTDNGVASWYDFAVAIQELAIEKGLLDKVIPIKAIGTKDYPTPATRPNYSVLDKSTLKEQFPNIELMHWRKQLSKMLDVLKLELS